MRAAPMLCTPEVHAVAIEILGPRRPNMMVRCPATMLTIVEGTKNGLILRGPPLTSELWFSSIAETANTGADSGANTGCILFRHFKARILHGLNASDNSILNEGIHLALFFARDNVITVKILY